MCSSSKPPIWIFSPNSTATRCTSRTIWKAETDSPSVNNYFPAEVSVAAEAYSRSEYLRALKRLGARGKANPIDEKGSVPVEIEKVDSDLIAMLDEEISNLAPVAKAKQS